MNQLQTHPIVDLWNGYLLMNGKSQRKRVSVQLSAKSRKILI